VSRYVDEHCGRFGVEPICKTLGVSVSAYYQRRSGQRSLGAVEDDRLLARIRELHAGNSYAYGYRQFSTVTAVRPVTSTPAQPLPLMLCPAQSSVTPSAPTTTGP
jgi:hypothetical protein